MKKDINKVSNFLIRIISLIIILLLLAIFIGFSWKNINSLFSKKEISRVTLITGYDFAAIEDIEEEEIFSIPESQAGFNDLSFISSPDGKSFAYIIKQEGGEKVVFNGQAGELYDSITFLVFSSDSRHFAYGVKKEGKESVVLDGQVSEAYDWIFKPYFFTPDSKHFVYKVRTDQGEMVVLDNKNGAIYDYVYAPFITTEGDKLVYYSRTNDKLWRTVVELE